MQAIGSFTWLFCWMRYPAAVVQCLVCEKPSKWNANEYQSYQPDNEVSLPLRHVILKALLVNCSICIGSWANGKSLMMPVSWHGIPNPCLRQTAPRNNGFNLCRLMELGSAEPPISLEHIPFVDKDVNDIEISTQTVSTASYSLSLCFSSNILYFPRMLSIAGQSKHSEILAHQSPTSQTCRNDHSSNHAR